MVTTPETDPDVMLRALVVKAILVAARADTLNAAVAVVVRSGLVAVSV
jgi:hypothetical protein